MFLLKEKNSWLCQIFKYLGIILDSNLTFKKHVKKVANTIRYNLANFRHIRPYLTTEAAKLFMDAMIFSNISYCFTSWSQANVTNLKPIETLYKQTLQILDQKPISYHHCNIIIKYNLFNFGLFLTLSRCRSHFQNFTWACTTTTGWIYTTEEQ